jgi:hypothetical protein
MSFLSVVRERFDESPNQSGEPSSPDPGDETIAISSVSDERMSP